MALVKPYCTVAHVQRETRNSDSTLDATYEESINLASRWIEEYCARDFWSHDHSTDVLKVPREFVIGNNIFLPYPILTLTEVITYAIDGTGSDTLAVDDEVWWENKGQLGIIRSEIPFPVKGGQYVTLKGIFGYTTTTEDAPPTDLPSGVLRACTLIAAAWSVEMKKQEVGLDGGIQELLDTRTPTEAMALLKKYRDGTRSNF